MNLNAFTLQELHLLADSLYWEFAVFEKSGWSDSVRAREIANLQGKIHTYIDTRENQA